jgi:hypothetical protein
MRKGGAVFLLYTLYSILYTIHAAPCFAEPLSSVELIENAKKYNNQIVEYQGEAVGDVMSRGEFAWVNVNDGQSAIGIWGKTDMIKKIVNYIGSYNYKGDIVSVKGVFHRACPQHGGDLDIHMEEMTRVREGYAIPHPIGRFKILSAFWLSAAALALFIMAMLKSGKTLLWKRK